MRTLMAMLVMSSFYSSLLSAAPFQPRLRTDLQKAAPQFCEEAEPSLAALQIYDAQVELAFVKGASDLDSFARGFAETNKHRGYGYGTCKDKRQWVVSTPAPDPLLRLDPAKKRVTIRYQALEKICAHFDVDAIEKGKDPPVSLIRGEAPGKLFDRIDLKEKLYTTITLTCHPMDRSKDGPELWALIALEAPETISGLNSEADVLAWIQDRRLKNGMSRLQPAGKDLQEVADQAADQKDLHHPRALLLSKKAQLKGQTIELLGENRASARDFSGLAQLLWNSPTHRRLLLNPKANAIALNTSRRGSEKLLVMVLAKQ